MKLNEVVEWFAKRGIVKDRSTFSKALKKVGVMAKSGKVTEIECAKAAKVMGWSFGGRPKPVPHVRRASLNGITFDEVVEYCHANGITIII